MTDENNKADLTNREDMSIAVMNLISLEEHLAFTAAKTGKSEYLHILSSIRKLRIKLLKPLVTNTEGELWCISKHLLATTMRLMEVSTKYLETDVEKAQEFEQSAFDLYGLFWLLQKMPNEKIAEAKLALAKVKKQVPELTKRERQDS